MKKVNSKPKKPAPTAADFQLVTWAGKPREYRFLGWRDDYSAIYLLDGDNKPLVLIPELVGVEGRVRFSESPTRIVETRLLPPPCRSTRAEAELLRDARKLPDGRVSTFHHATREYLAEAARRGICNPTPPEQWELIHEESLAPIQDEKPATNWPVIEIEMRNIWASKHGITLQGMVDERAAFTRRHGGELALLARVRYRMEFKTVVNLWLEELRGPQPPDNIADLDQIKRMLDARPGLVRLTPEIIKETFGRIPDKRTWQKWCSFASVDSANPTRADLPALKLADEHFRDRQRTKGTSGQKKQAKKAKAEDAKYSRE